MLTAVRSASSGQPSNALLSVFLTHIERFETTHPLTMTNPERQPDTDEVRATLNRMYALIETSDFTNEDERSALRHQLDALQSEIDEDEESRLPTGFHEALQKTEVLAIKQLLESPAEDAASSPVGKSWDELETAIKQIVTAWEARHPKLAVAFAKFTDVLARIGI